MSSRRDVVVVVGGGHNGPVAAAYLARNGLDVVVCERREVAGGLRVRRCGRAWRLHGPHHMLATCGSSAD